jgi:hypothetical protein
MRHDRANFATDFRIHILDSFAYVHDGLFLTINRPGSAGLILGEGILAPLG